MFYFKKFPRLFVTDLQLFADGGNSGTGAAEASADNSAALAMPKSAKSPAAEIKYGIQDEVPPAEVQSEEKAEEVDLDAEFEELIKGKYKEQYGKRTQDTIEKRLKSSKETVEKYNALTPTLEMLAKKYGVASDDIDALNKAIEEDDAYYEQEASEKGMSVESLKEIRKMERENAQLRRQMQEQSVKENADKLYADWLGQSEQLKAVYPAFNLESEIQNPKFLDLLKSNIDVRTAYEVLHKDEIIPAAMKFTAQNVEQKLTNKIRANGARPMENGTSSQSPIAVKSDVSQLTKADLAEINRRVSRGEKIRF